MGKEACKEKLTYIRLLISLFFAGMLGAGYAYFQLPSGSPSKTYFLITVSMLLVPILVLSWYHRQELDKLEELEEKEKCH